MQRIFLTFTAFFLTVTLTPFAPPTAHAQSAKDQAAARAKAKQVSKADAKAKAKAKALIQAGGPSITMAPNSAKRMLLKGSAYDYSDMVSVAVVVASSGKQAAAVTARFANATVNGQSTRILVLQAGATAKPGKYVVRGMTRTNQPRPMRLTVIAPKPKPTDNTKPTPKPTKRPDGRTGVKPGSPKARSFFNARALKPGISVTRARALTAEANKSMAKHIAAIRAKRESQFQQANRLIASDRARLEQVLKADKTGTYAKLLADKAKIDNSKLTPDQKFNAMKQLLVKNQAFIKASIGRANIDAKQLTRRVGGVFKDAKFKVMMANTGVRRGGSQAGETPAPSSDNTASSDVPPFIGTAPYPVFGDRPFNSGLTIASVHCEGNAETGMISHTARVVNLIGSVNGTAYVGHTVQVPDNIQAMDIKVTVQTDYRLFALAALAATGGSADLVFQVDGPTGQIVRQSQNLGTVVAPLLWHASVESVETVTFRKRINTPAAGEYEIRAIAIGEAWTAGIGGATQSKNRATVTEIRVDFITE